MSVSRDDSERNCALKVTTLTKEAPWRKPSPFVPKTSFAFIYHFSLETKRTNSREKEEVFNSPRQHKMRKERARQKMIRAKRYTHAHKNTGQQERVNERWSLLRCYVYGACVL